HCALWKSRHLLAQAMMLLKAAGGADWDAGSPDTCFDCTELTVDMGGLHWLVLDGEPVRADGPLTIRFIPNALRVCAFGREQRSANDNGTLSAEGGLKRGSSGSGPH